MRDETFDERGMRLAIVMARRGLGTTAPNPSVGAVLIDKSGVLIARAVTQPGGRPHAEPQALARAGAAARGAVLFVTLEPCAHFGKTPPCADAIIASGVARVVVGVRDPDPRTAGQGLQKLRDAGISVTEGVLEDAARRVTLGHILRVTEKRPFVTLKLALSADGDVPRGRAGEPRWVTGAVARARGHLLRAEADAIIAGAGTVRDDDPDLTCRLPGLAGRSPLRVVLSRNLDMPLRAKVFASAALRPTWVFTGERAPSGRRAALEQSHVRVFSFPSEDGLDIEDVLAELAEEGITRVLVEGGPSLWQAFGAAGCVDEVQMFVAGPGTAAPEAMLQRYVPAVDLSLAGASTIGADSLYVFHPKH